MGLKGAALSVASSAQCLQENALKAWRHHLASPLWAKLNCGKIAKADLDFLFRGRNRLSA
jgi:hypothetical protein